MTAPKLKISEFHVFKNYYHDGKKSYRVEDLIELAKDQEAFDLPLAGIPIGDNPWDGSTIKSFVYHVTRVNNADLSYPIILDVEGHIADGWHRVCKAILEGRKYIKAVRLTVMPDPISD
ncbi:hypothetical protein [Microbulbifer epialgicus]|uniref:ParB-like nuclease domain-containing protein n=1 Tax=Microbulbifer epialgicus TaxID=393907 RepID=A0ABV4P6M0_9GAMM